MIVLDTNILIDVLKYKIELDSLREFGEFIVLSTTKRELKNLSEKKSKDGMFAGLALQLIKNKKIKIAKTEGKTDASIVKYSKAHKCAVATNDRELIKTLKMNGIKIIRIRQRKFFVCE